MFLSRAFRMYYSLWRRWGFTQLVVNYPDLCFGADVMIIYSKKDEQQMFEQGFNLSACHRRKFP